MRDATHMQEMRRAMADMQGDTRSDRDILDAAISELRRLADDGAAPSTSHYNRHRHPDAPSATVIARRLGLRWTELTARAGLEHVNPRSHPLEDGALPDFVRQQIAHGCRCECGRRATQIGRFNTLNPSQARMANAIIVCDECAALLDPGVRLERIEQEKVTA